MANENIIGPEREENQQPPATPARRVLNQLFVAALTPFTAIHNQLQPQEVIIRDLERELNINHSDITSTPSDREPHIGASSGGNHNEDNEENEERTIGIAEINLVHHQEEVAEDNIDSTNDTNANEEDSEEEEDSDKEDLNEEEVESEEEDDSDSPEILFGAEDARKIDEESEDSDNEESEDSMSSSLNCQGTGTNGRQRS